MSNKLTPGQSYRQLKKAEDSIAPKGFISPEGSFHSINDKSDHHDWIHQQTKANHPHLHVKDRPGKPGENADASYTQAMHAGWMSVGIGRDSGGTGHNVQAHHEFLSNRSHPATQKVREIARKHWGDHFEAMLHTDSGLKRGKFDTVHFARHGTLKEHK